MAKFLNTSRAYAEIEDIAVKASKELVLISPFIQFPDLFLERLKDVDKRNFKITIVCREEDLTPETKNDLKSLSNLELRFLKNLHAKCFYNQASMVITSLNLYDYSQQNNREMGVLITLKDDRDLFLDALNESNFIVRSATIFKPSKIKDAIEIGSSLMKQVNKVLNQDLGQVFNPNKIENTAYCIRCGRAIPLNVNKPYCLSCHEQWEKQGKRYNFKESHCHAYGKQAPVSFAKPQCGACFGNT
jgi:hypothetical protein